jgi:endonuclease YncB( thermonuclease family)
MFVLGMNIAAAAEPMIEVIDGDTFRLDGEVIRIHGIDAPETGQKCESEHGRTYRCGVAAAKALEQLLERSPPDCEGRERDDYGRLIAICMAGEEDIGATLVIQGLALAFRRFSDDYVTEEDAAREAHRGLWQGTFEAPWEYRARRWDISKDTAPNPACPIKGNINRNGEHIYHAPWSPSYDRTKIDESKGERWFCSEGEAIASGWRAPLN